MDNEQIDLSSLSELSLGYQIDAILRQKGTGISMTEGAMMVISKLGSMISDDEIVLIAANEDVSTEKKYPALLSLKEDDNGYVFMFSDESRIDALPQDLADSLSFIEVSVDSILSRYLKIADQIEGIAVNPFSNSEGIFIINREIADTALSLAQAKERFEKQEENNQK